MGGDWWLNSLMHVGLHCAEDNTTRWYWVSDVDGKPALVEIANEVASPMIENALNMEQQQRKDREAMQ